MHSDPAISHESVDGSSEPHDAYEESIRTGHRSGGEPGNEPRRRSEERGERNPLDAPRRSAKSDETIRHACSYTPGTIRSPPCRHPAGPEKDRAMTVLMLSNMFPSPDHPAFGVFVRNQVECLESRHRHRMILVVAREDPERLLRKILKYTMLHIRAWGAVFRRFDLVHLHYASSAHILAASPILLLCNKPVIVTIHRGEIYTLPDHGVRKSIVGRFLRKAKAVIAVSADLESKLRDNLGVEASKITVIDVGCDLRRFRPTPPGTKAMAKERVGLPPDTATILFVGSLISRKGLDFLLRALSKQSASRQLKLLLVGRGPDHGQLLKLADRLGISDRILWLGERSNDELPDWYSAADIFVLPSRSEGTPTVLLEAMASGCPIVASRVGGIPEVITHGINGLLFDVDDGTQFERQLTCLLDDAGTRERLGARAHLDAKDHSLERQVDRIAEIYRVVREDTGVDG